MTKTENLELIVFGWIDALRRRDPERIADRLSPDIVWQGLRRDLVCPDRTAVLNNITAGGPVRERVTAIEVAAVDDHRVLLGVQLPDITEFLGETLEGEMFDVFTIKEGLIVRIDEFKSRADALAFACSSPPSSVASHGPANEASVSREPRVERVVPILNVSDIHASFEWFEKLGWDRGFEWKADPADDAPGFGAVRAGGCEIFLCRDGQGGRGKGANHSTFGPGGETSDKGVWMSIWVDDVDAIHRRCVSEGLDITHPPADEPWGVREFHVRHPDGHVFRISTNL